MAEELLEIKEAYRAYAPPINATRIIRKLLASVPERYLRGLDCVVLTDMAGQPRRHRLGKTTSRGRRIAQARVEGRYHPEWKGQPPWIELYVDQILKAYPRWAVWIPLIKYLALGDTLFHEIGHHVHYTVRPEHREGEDVADDWKKKFTGNFVRNRYWYLIPVLRAVNFFRRN